MTTIVSNNSKNIAVKFLANGGDKNDIMVFALEQGEFWFCIGEGYKTLKGAKRAAVKKMAKHGYTFNEKEMESLTL
jgi:hypothetical protein